ncbi:hypothetical protein OAA02_00460 [bacterium]|nr:hypothetical protein [bacterium]
MTHLAAATTAARPLWSPGTHSVNRFLVILNIHVSVFIWGNLWSFLNGSHARLVATMPDSEEAAKWSSLIVKVLEMITELEVETFGDFIRGLVQLCHHRA